jgi:hypothetical protein
VNRRKRLDGVALVALISAILLSARLIAGCTPAGRWHAANVVLDVLQCVLANEAKPDVEVVAACAGQNVSPDDVRKILASHRAAVARAGVCVPDAGR